MADDKGHGLQTKTPLPGPTAGALAGAQGSLCHAGLAPARGRCYNRLFCLVVVSVYNSPPFGPPEARGPLPAGWAPSTRVSRPGHRRLLLFAPRGLEARPGPWEAVAERVSRIHAGGTTLLPSPQPESWPRGRSRNWAPRGLCLRHSV